MTSKNGGLIERLREIDGGVVLEKPLLAVDLCEEAAAAIEALEARVERMRGALEHVLRCEDDARDNRQNGGGLLDCIDNTCQFYQSADLADALRKARAALSDGKEDSPNDR